MKWDIHLHSTFSDGMSEMRKIFEAAKRKGLDGLVVTDHDTTAHQKKAEEMGREYGIETLPGIEISTMFGDIIAIGIEEVPTGDAEEIIDEIHSMGGVAIAAHPFGGYWEVSFAEMPEFLSLFDAWEILNGGVSREGNMRALEFGLKNKVVGTAGSDSHYHEDVGSCFVVVEDDLLSSIRSGKVLIGTEKEDLLEIAEKWNEYMKR